MQMIIGSKNNSKIKTDKLKVEVDKLSKAEIKLKINKAIIFSIIDLITNLVLKPYAIAYNSKTKMLLITYLYFVNDK